MHTDIIATVAAASWLVGTNTNGIAVLAVLAVLNVSLHAGGRRTAGQIWAGQFAAIAVWVVVSLLAAFGPGPVRSQCLVPTCPRQNPRSSWDKYTIQPFSGCP